MRLPLLRSAALPRLRRLVEAETRGREGEGNGEAVLRRDGGRRSLCLLLLTGLCGREGGGEEDGGKREGRGGGGEERHLSLLSLPPADEAEGGGAHRVVTAVTAVATTASATLTAEEAEGRQRTLQEVDGGWDAAEDVIRGHGRRLEPGERLITERGGRGDHRLHVQGGGRRVTLRRETGGRGGPVGRKRGREVGEGEGQRQLRLDGEVAGQLID